MVSSGQEGEEGEDPEIERQNAEHEKRKSSTSAANQDSHDGNSQKSHAEEQQLVPRRVEPGDIFHSQNAELLMTVCTVKR